MKNMNVEGNDYIIPLHKTLLFSGDFFPQVQQNRIEQTA